MRRIRVLRLLLPVALLLFVALIVIAITPRTTVHPETVLGGGNLPRAKAEGIEITQRDKNRQTLSVRADTVVQEEGRLHAKGIREFLVYRDPKPPLKVSADVGEVEGAVGQRTMQFVDGVRVIDPHDGLTVRVPMLNVDEAAAEARSEGRVTLEGQRLSGGAELVVYGLDDQPTRIEGLDLTNDDGLRLTAPRAMLYDGLDDVELFDAVRLTRGGDVLDAGNLRLFRDEQDRLRRILARSGVSADWTTGAGLPAEVRTRELELEWDAQGTLERLQLDGDAEVRHAHQSIAAGKIRGRREGTPGHGAEWRFHADDSVYLRGRIGRGPAWLRSERLEAVLDESFAVLRAEVSGRMRFDGPDLGAEAARATLERIGESYAIELFAGARQRARLAQGQTRIAAERISTDAGGEQLLARERVEATLLGAAGGGAGEALGGLFRADEAVHFVAGELRGSHHGERLVFRDSVRGWQGDQNLSAARVEIDQARGSVTAEGRVNTRFPRDPESAAAGEAAYIHVAADRLDYQDALRQAIYREDVHVRLAEGWLESARLEVDLGEAGGVRELRALVDVEIEFRDPAEEGAPQRITGRADRLVYTPHNATVWLFGVDAPASVRRLGENSGTTTGKVLRYRLDEGTLEVESGEQGPGRIRTGAKSPPPSGR